METITVDSVSLAREYRYDHEGNLTLLKDRNGHYFAYQFSPKASQRVTAGG